MMEQIVKKQLLKIGIIAEKSSKVFWWAKTKQQLEKMNADMVFLLRFQAIDTSAKLA